ncbi:MAG TPA: hypothetical protein VKI41_06510, partial [Vicinamibacteria bacterium]|nr:hypothetical protein [Vicinamibacteria bacterium]
SMLLGGSAARAENELRAGTVVGEFTAEGKKTELKYAYARWEKALLGGAVGIAVVLTELPASAANIAATGKAQYLSDLEKKENEKYQREVGGAIRFAMAPDGTIVDYSLGRPGWGVGKLGGKASKFVLAGGKLDGELTGHGEELGKWEYRVSFDVPLGPRPPELK